MIGSNPLFSFGVFTAVFLIEVLGMGWVFKKYDVLDPGGEYYNLETYYCEDCGPPFDKPFFSVASAILGSLKGTRVVRYNFPATYITRSHLKFNSEPSGVSKKVALNSKLSLKNKFERWYWYRRFTKNAVFKENSIRLVEIRQRRHGNLAILIQVYSISDYFFRKFPLIVDNLPFLPVEHGKIYLAKLVFFTERLNLDCILFKNGELWPPRELMFGWFSIAVPQYKKFP